MVVTVRNASEVDAELISSLHAEVQALHAAALPEWFKPPDECAFPASMIRDLLLTDDRLIFVAMLGGEGVGYAYAQVVRQPESVWRHARHAVYLNQIGVRSTARRQGVGRGLLVAVEAAAKARGIDQVGIDFWSFNEPARAFFRDCGFAAYNERLWKRTSAD